LNSWYRRGAGPFAGACFALFLFPQSPLFSHDPITTNLTWAQEISRIVYKRCGSCHHAGGAAMPLTNYEEARPWAKAIRDEVLTRRMPPWGAVKGIGDFTGDPSLSQPEMDMIVAWVEGGAPEGDPAALPAHLPSFRVEPVQRPAYSRTISVTGMLKLSRQTTVIALRPEGLADGASLEAMAVEPDGTVRHLIWLKDYRKSWTRDYVLSGLLALPAGTTLRTAGTSGSLLLFVK
jgi:hypothetical protein